jgi:hypothetical protein
MSVRRCGHSGVHAGDHGVHAAVAFGGLLLLGNAGYSGDSFVLALPIVSGAPALAWLVFLGGLSAGTGMIMCETITVATMVSNHLVLPILDAFPPLAKLRRHLLATRWCAAALLIVAGFGYVDAFGSRYDLVSMGLVAHIGVLITAPVILAGLYWRGASTVGAVAGVLAGFATWAYTLIVPIFARAGWLPPTLVTKGPAGISALRPEALFGISGLDAFPHAFVWILVVSGAAFVFGSLLFPASAEEVHASSGSSARSSPRPCAPSARPAARWRMPPRSAPGSSRSSASIARASSPSASPTVASRRSGPRPRRPLGAAARMAAVGGGDDARVLHRRGRGVHGDPAREAGVPTEARAISKSYARLLADLKVPGRAPPRDRLSQRT